MKQGTVVALTVFALSAWLPIMGCEKVSHDNIEKWQRTAKGPGKLAKALRSDESADLRAHAAQVLIRMQQLDDVKATIDKMSDKTRERVVSELIPLLWQDAEVKGTMTMPSPEQSQAKDALFELRDTVGDKARAEIDGYLVKWLTGGFYEGRARVGRNSGRKVIRAIGVGAGPSLVQSAQVILAAPADNEKKFARLGDELLIALAASGHSDALNLLMDLVEKKQRDDTLAKRAMNALYQAVLKSGGVEPLPGEKLAPIAKRLEAMAKNESIGARTANDAVDLLAALSGDSDGDGLPDCLAPFVSIVAYPHSAEAFRYIGTQRGIRCGKAKAIVPITEAMPTAVAYPRHILNKYLWREIAALPARQVVAERARGMLASKSWVSRVTGIELLGILRLKATAKKDAEMIAKLGSDRTKLRNWHQDDDKKGKSSLDSTIGKVATRVAAELVKL